MISFENVDKITWTYKILYPYVKICHNYLFYRKFYVINSEKIPEDKPVIVICNHQNGLSDALSIIFAFSKNKKYPVFIARADIFKKEFVAKLLRSIRIMPAYRAIDCGREKLSENIGIFNKAGRIVAEGGIVGLFPEAGHENCHHLGTFKSGFARIAFQVAEIEDFKKPIYILPLSNHYSNYFGFHNDLVITIGDAFSFEDLYDIYKEYPEKARKILAQRSREKVKSIMLDIEDKEFYEEYDIIRTLYAPVITKKEKQKKYYYPNIFNAEKKTISMLDSIKNNDREAYHILMKDAREYSGLLGKLRLQDWVLAENFTLKTFFLRLLLAILILPFLIYGFINNFIPYNLSTLVTRKIKDQMLHASFHFGMGVLINFPVCYLIAYLIVLLNTNWWISLIYLVSLPLSFFVYLRSKILLKKQILRIYRFGCWWRGDWQFRKAIEIRKKIILTLNKYC